MAMEDIDLGDRRELIDLIYGNPQKAEVNDTPSASSNTLTPLTENKKNQKKEKSNVSCSFATVVMLFILAVAAAVLSGFAAYWFTRQKFEMQMAEMNYVPQPRRNMSLLAAQDEMYEEEEPIVGPTPDELRLPQNVEPLWYNLTLRTYVPGGAAIVDEKNLTTDGNIMIKLNVLSNTVKITLNAKNLTLPSDASKVRILTEVPHEHHKREALNETNVEEEKPEELINMTVATDLEHEPIITQHHMPELLPHGVIVNEILYNATLEQVMLVLDKPLQAGEQVIVQMPFSGYITENADGLHQSIYRTRNGSKKILTFTSLQPGSTRSIYPSLDEPQYQAPVSLTILHPKGTVARANGIEITESRTDDRAEPLWEKTSFAATEALPAYLSGFTVSDFDSREANAQDGTKVRVYARPEATESANSTTYALETAIKVLDLLQDYFGVPLSSQKLDLFAVPVMEGMPASGPGLIFMPEDELVISSNKGTVEEKVKVARALANQLTRQWFGNLVTPSDWHALWLNEAFANYMEYYLLQKLFDGNVDAQSYQTGEALERALVEDARSSSHPLTLNIETAAEAQELLDKTTADKGGALLRMINAVVGEEAFQKGMQTYLKNHANGNANYTDFWAALDEANGDKLTTWNGNKLKMEEFAENWILQMGYPVIDVYRLDAKTVELTQRRFKLDHLTPERAKYRNALYWYKWDVPLFYEVAGEKQPLNWLHEAVRLPLNLTDTLLINPESLGYYRVNYDEQGWDALADQLQKDHKKFPPPARARIISDALALAESGQLPYDKALGVLKYLPQEDSYLPWTVALRGLRSLYERLSRTELEDEAQKFVLDKIHELFNSLDPEHTSATEDAKFLESQMHKELVALNCELSPEDCEKKLGKEFDGIMSACKDENLASDCSKVDPFIRPWVYCYGVAKGGQKEFDLIHNLYEKEVNAAEKKRLLEALACSKEPRHLRKLLHDSVHSETSAIPTSDIDTLVGSMNNQPVGAEIVSNFVLDNWKDLVERFSLDKSTLSNILENAIRLDSDREVKQFERFLTDHKSTTTGLPAMKLQLEKARNQVNWLKTNKKAMKDLLSSRHSEKDL